jgi:hypothetical protein
MPYFLYGDNDGSEKLKKYCPVGNKKSIFYTKIALTGGI